jgi:predicted signal transduction protein with EAL and GGDEF domain
VPWHAATSDEVLQRSDSAMYLAKRDKTGYIVYNPNRDDRLTSRASLASTMRLAIDARQFVLDYQPIVHLRTNTVIADRIAGALESSGLRPAAAGRVHPRRRTHRPGESADVVRARVGDAGMAALDCARTAA